MAVGVLCFVGSNDYRGACYAFLFQKEEVVLRVCSRRSHSGDPPKAERPESDNYLLLLF